MKPIPYKLVLIFADSFADEEGNVVSAFYYGISQDFLLESLLTVTFVKDEGK